ncbi:sensor histidine kinase [Nocardia iowensis]|uniref:Sensor histidine kinase n=1 Tax=Nocardia iowensis TaxID=204891 RepID=A0ABX8RVZ0_NOCIO|nr:sensor histidine kinase [Nocardia iowensis]QXN93431.1 sensor histidine kinase [Nocardia iowensis]
MGVSSGLASLRAGGVSGLIDRVLEDQSVSVNPRRRGWFGTLVAVVWLVWLVAPIVQRWSRGELVTAGLATACLAAFATLIVGSFLLFRRPGPRALMVERPIDRRIWLTLAALTALHVALVVLLGPIALPTVIYIAVVAIVNLPLRESGYVVVAVMAAMLLLPVLMPGRQLADMPFYLAFVPVAIWVARQLGLRGERLAELARRQRAELDIVEERNRVARDVHDILGHSLTVITVKTELAQRLVDVDLGRAKAELADIERLAREALAGVRDTVGGLREVSLRGELANARTALAAADIAADLPTVGQLPDTPHSELFGWVLREAITNVIRHSAARHCTVTVTASSIEVVDDGRGLGASAASGSGLAGLRARVMAAGGTLTLSVPECGGVRVRAIVPE